MHFFGGKRETEKENLAAGFEAIAVGYSLRFPDDLEKNCKALIMDLSRITAKPPEKNLVAAFVLGAIGTVGFAIFGRDVPLEGADRRII
jgi:hypothetical protein